MWPLWSQDSEIDCILKSIEWNRLIFALLIQIWESQEFLLSIWAVLVKSGLGLLDLETLKFAVSQEWIDKMSYFLHFFSNLGKLKDASIIFGWAWSNTGIALQITGLLNQVHLANDLMNWADWLNDFCILIVIKNVWFDSEFTLYLWHLNAGGPLQLCLARFFPPEFLGKFSFGQKQNMLNNNPFFFILKNFVIGFCWKPT